MNDQIQHWGTTAVSDGGSGPIVDIGRDIYRIINTDLFENLSSTYKPKTRQECILLETDNPYVEHAIELHKFSNAIQDLMCGEENSTNDNKYLLLPKMPTIEMRHKRNDLNYVPKEFTSFSKGLPVDMPTLSRTNVRVILRRAIALLFAQIGYETTKQSIMDILLDVVEEFFKKLGHHINVAVDDEMKHGVTGFPNIAERVLTELGMGGIKGVMDYYQARIVKYAYFLHERCAILHDEYTKKLLPRSPSPTYGVNNKFVKVKIEKEEDAEVENAEVHFSATDGDMNYSILETGYQLLNSLEAEAKYESSK